MVLKHDKQTVAEHVLMNCVHRGPGGQSRSPTPGLRRRLIGGLEVPVVSLARYCAWCGSHYQGVKVLRQLPDRYLQHRRGELADELLRQHSRE